MVQIVSARMNKPYVFPLVCDVLFSHLVVHFNNEIISEKIVKSEFVVTPDCSDLSLITVTRLVCGHLKKKKKKTTPKDDYWSFSLLL